MNPTNTVLTGILTPDVSQLDLQGIIIDPFVLGDTQTINVPQQLPIRTMWTLFNLTPGTGVKGRIRFLINTQLVYEVPWFFTPSLPPSSFLSSPLASRLLRSTATPNIANLFVGPAGNQVGSITTADNLNTLMWERTTNPNTGSDTLVPQSPVAGFNWKISCDQVQIILDQSISPANTDYVAFVVRSSLP